jgi:hypothetical protein
MPGIQPPDIFRNGMVRAEYLHTVE